MKHIILLILASLFLVPFATAGTLDILQTDLNITLEPGSQQTLPFDIKNTGTTDFSAINFSSTIDTTDNDNDQMTIVFSNPGTLNAGETKQVTMTITTESVLDINTYSGTLTATSGTEQDTATVAITIEPVICDFGPQGSDLTLTIEKPTNGKDYKPGETITIKANVENNGSKDIDVKVEAFLFGDEDEIRGASSKVLNIDNGDEEDFTFTLDLPTDSRRIESDEDYSLFVKAYDDDKESNECTQKKTNVNINLNKNDVIIDEKLSQFEPAATTCGGLTTAVLHAINIGDDQQEDAYFTLTNSQLKINEQTSTFDIDDFNSDENNAVTKRIQFKIPETAKNGNYIFTAAIRYSGKQDDLTLPLMITGCEKTVDGITNTGGVIKATTSTFTTQAGRTISIPVKITNTNGNGIFTVDIINTEEFGTPVGNVLVELAARQERTVFTTLRMDSTLEPGRYSATLLLTKNGQALGSDTVYIDITPAPIVTPPSFLTSISKAPLWFLGLLGLIIIGALLIMIIALYQRR
ncbi:MAG: putative S-layer protein [Nanoarchaeota archaeon]|nr:putative S-layer protein [Nanoarchaeota archaeon]